MIRNAKKKKRIGREKWDRDGLFREGELRVYQRKEWIKTGRAELATHFGDPPTTPNKRNVGDVVFVENGPQGPGAKNRGPETGVVLLARSEVG